MKSEHASFGMAEPFVEKVQHLCQISELNFTRNVKRKGKTRVKEMLLKFDIKR